MINHIQYAILAIVCGVKILFNYLAEKYFDDIVEYNKDIVSYKRAFFNNAELNDFYYLLNALTFNTYYDSTNYRWGQRIFDKKNSKLSWISSTNKHIQAYYWDNDSHQSISYNKKAIFTSQMIHDHFLSCYGNNRKYNVFYDNKQDLKDYEQSFVNLYKIVDKTFGSTQSLNTDVLLIDIDNYEERHSIETLGMLLDFLNIDVKELIMLEQNAFTGGLHTAIKLPNRIYNPNFYAELMKYLKQNDINIECNFINHILRFPLSYEYVALQRTNDIFNYDEFIPQSLWESSFTDFLCNLNLEPCQSKKLINLLNEFDKTKTFGKWDNYWKTKKQLFFKPSGQNIEKYFKFHTIHKGHRFESLSKLVPIMKGMNYSLDDTVDKIFQLNVDSKDLNKWSKEQLKQNISNFYDKCNLVIKVKNRSYNGFISNMDRLSEQSLSMLSDPNFAQYITKKFAYHYCQERSKHNLSINSVSNAKMNIWYQQIPFMIKEIIGSMMYSINNPKSTTINERIGYQLSNQYLEQLQQYSIKALNLDSDDSLTRTSLQYLKKALIKTLSLREIAYHSRKRNWQLGSCKSYEIININDLYSLLNHLFNSFTRMTYNNLIKKDANIIKKETFYIYYSTKNLDFEANDEKNLKNCKNTC